MTRRMERVFSPGEFGLLIWNNLFVDKAVDGNKTVTMDGVNLMTKQELVHQGKEPYSIASVIAVYEVQYMFYNTVQKAFSQSLENTQVWLLDERVSTPNNQRILAMWDSGLTPEQMKSLVMESKAKTKDQLCENREKFKSLNFQIPTLADGTILSVLVLPKDDYSYGTSEFYPNLILILSLVLATVAQVERWIGHPVVISSTKLWQAKVENELRQALEPEIVHRSSVEAEQLKAQVDGESYKA